MKTLVTKSFLAISFFLSLASFAPVLMAQTGRISGQVVDATQAVVPGAVVTMENPINGDRRQIITDNAGRYTFPTLPIGRYTVRVEKLGFQTQVKQDIAVGVGAAVTEDFALPTGQISEQVQVTGDAAVVQTEGSTTGGVMENRQLTELPINGRDYARFSLLIVPTANPIWGSRRPAHNTGCKSDVRAIFSGSNRESTRSPR